MLIPIEIPAGVYKNGTDYQAKGRWIDSNLVRWHEGTIQPVGGWRKATTALGDELMVSGTARGSHTWRDNGTERYLAIGTHSNLYARIGQVSALLDITPVGFTVGFADTQANTGYGGYAYGFSSYGTPRPAISTSLAQEATTWSMDNFGQNLVALSSTDGILYLWDLNPANIAVAVTPTSGLVPTQCTGLVVTDERFIFLLQADGDRRRVQWADQESLTDWAPTATNQAGAFELQSSGELMQGIRGRGETLLLTSTDAHTAKYIGAPFVYSFERVGSQCGAISRNAGISIDNAIVWMGEECFYMYDGFVKNIPCDMSDFVFTNMNTVQKAKVWASHDSRYDEVTWYYPTGIEVDSYVTWNYRTNCWYGGSIDRTTGSYNSVYSVPFRVDSAGYVYEHEFGFNHWGSEVFLESAPIELGNGDQVFMCKYIIPDEKSQGQVNASFKTSFYPNAPEYNFGSFSLENPTSVRFTGRQIKMKIQAVESVDWRVGRFRLEVEKGGLR